MNGPKKTYWLLSRATVIAALVLIGPLALPLLLLSPAFSGRTKIWAAALVLAATVLMALFSAKLIDVLEHQLERMIQ